MNGRQAKRLRDKLTKSRAALEAAWVVIYCKAGGHWDTLSDLEAAIGALTGETDVQVNQRLARAHRGTIQQHTGKMNRQADERQRAEQRTKALEERIAELTGAVRLAENCLDPNTDPPLGGTERVLAVLREALAAPAGDNQVIKEEPK